MQSTPSACVTPTSKSLLSQGPVLFGTTFLLIGVGLLVMFVGLLGQSVAVRERDALAMLTVRAVERPGGLS